ncbi:DUF2860 domain-containing protein [Vibrio lamellibrachiae]|uniref:DUF2860 family protein n=1 Tax=Vibrio lamellibrachiae TaxID=2910253 RepID=UPI003D146F71
MTNHFIPFFTFIALTLSTSFSVQAFDAKRFSGNFSINTGVTSSNSNLDTEGDSRLGNITSKGSSNTDFFVGPLGNFEYKFDKERFHSVYLGTSRDDLAVGTLAFELGYRFTSRRGTKLDLAFLPTIVANEMWSDPYATGSERVTTDVDGRAYRFKFTNIMESRFSFDMAYAIAKFDDEAISDQSLHRESDSLYYKIQHLTMLTPHTGFTGAVNVINHDAQGDAASFDQYTGEVTYFYNTPRHFVSLTGSYGNRKYDAAHPYFGGHRKDDIYFLFLAYEYRDLENWDNWSITSFAGASITTSNFDFYESDEYLMSVGLNYQF